jgi:hypothetical protein
MCMKRLRIAAAIAATALALVPLALAVTCSYTRYRSEQPYYITAIAEIYGTSSANSYGYARGETESAVCVISRTGTRLHAWSCVQLYWKGYYKMGCGGGWRLDFLGCLLVP